MSTSETHLYYGDFVGESVPVQGYHVRTIARGVVGEASKIVEEAEEFADAIEQGCKVMALVELSDMLLAIEQYMVKHHPGMTIDDLAIMGGITRRAFDSGQRKSRNA